MPDLTGSLSAHYLGDYHYPIETRDVAGNITWLGYIERGDAVEIRGLRKGGATNWRIELYVLRHEVSCFVPIEMLMVFQ